MTENEIKLINIIREHIDPEQDLMDATDIILSYLTQHESYPKPSAVVLQE